jgi:hypothetical protein
MVQQARAAQVSMNSPSASVPTSPFIHDKSDNQYCRNGPGCAGDGEDREVRYRDGSTIRQRQMVSPAGMGYSDSQAYINYLPRRLSGRGGVIVRPPRDDSVTGTVNMSGYISWLRENGYDLGTLQVQ